MAKFIPQDTFNMIAASAAYISAAYDKNTEESTALIITEYKRYYQDDNLERDIVKAADMIKKFYLGVFPPEALVGAITQLQFCIKNYHPDGTKKRMKLFNGMFFSKEKKEINNKVANCLVHVNTYYIYDITDKIPMYPDGWSL